MNIDWVQIITTVLLVIAGYFVSYFKTKSKLIDSATAAIVHAENTYSSYTKAGQDKFNWAVNYLYELVPAPLKFIFTQEMIGKIVQTVFDKIEAYANKQLDKIVDKIGG